MKDSFLVLFLFSFGLAFGQLETGVRIDSVHCSDDYSQSYALYLPSNYSDDHTWPIVYFFEPAARGSFPVETYRSVAEEYGVILACTNNSRNGSWEPSFEAADAVFLDTKNRLSIDSERMFTSGFSGGSRLALTLANKTKNIRGVLAVAGANPSAQYQVKPNADFLYVGLVGNRDMNYQEHISFSQKLDELRVKNILIISTKEHRWAPVEDFGLGLAWLLHNTKSTQNENFSDERLVKLVGKKLEAAKDSLIYFDQVFLGKVAKDLNPSFDFETPSDELLKNLRERTNSLAQKEAMIRKQLSDSMNVVFMSQGRDKSRKYWVMKQADKYKEQFEKTDDKEWKQMLGRTIYFLGAMSIETAFSHMRNKDFERALVGIEVWARVSSNEMWGNWWFAIIYAYKGKSKKSIKHLQKMIELGFKNKNTLTSEPAFAEMQQLSSFQELLKTMGD